MTAPKPLPKPGTTKLNGAKSGAIKRATWSLSQHAFADRKLAEQRT
jgi:hypothetical protein